MLLYFVLLNKITICCISKAKLQIPVILECFSGPAFRSRIWVVQQVKRSPIKDFGDDGDPPLAG
ncbi:hypothetical protein BCU80_03855 [Vibrio breoganii]|nr:hypothetical protein BCU80_03855 [Vibrio breoganii]